MSKKASFLLRSGLLAVVFFAVLFMMAGLGQAFSTIGLFLEDDGGGEVGSVITWSATAAGAQSTSEYAFYVYRTVGATTTRVHTQWWQKGSTGTINYTPSSPGLYHVRAFARDTVLGKKMIWADSEPPINVEVTGDELEINEVNDPAPDVIGESYQWTVEAQGGQKFNGYDYQYAFYIYEGSTRVRTKWWTNAGPGGEMYVNYTPNSPDPTVYKARAFVRDKTGRMLWADSGGVSFDPGVGADPLSFHDYGEDDYFDLPDDPSDIGELTWKVEAEGGRPFNGGTDYYQYAFYVYRDGQRVKTLWWHNVDAGVEAEVSYFANLEADYHVRAFIRDAESSMIWKDSDPVTVEGAEVGVFGIDEITPPGGTGAEDWTWEVIMNDDGVDPISDGVIEYAYQLIRDGAIVASQWYGEDAEYENVPSLPGVYKLRVFARDMVEGSAVGADLLDSEEFAVQVLNDDQKIKYDTIQAAIDEAVAEETIKVAAGTYDEPKITVNKTLTLLGPNAGVNPNEGARMRGELPEAVIENGFLISSNVNGVTVNGLKWVGKHWDSLSTNRRNLTIEYNVFSDIDTGNVIAHSVTNNEGRSKIRYNRFLNVGGVYMALQLGGAQNQLDVEYNYIDGTERQAIHISSSDVEDVNIRHNVIKNANRMAQLDRGAIRLKPNGDWKDLNITNNLISNCFVGLSIAEDAADITGLFDNVDISSNVIKGKPTVSNTYEINLAYQQVSGGSFTLEVYHDGDWQETVDIDYDPDYYVSAPAVQEALNNILGDDEAEVYPLHRWGAYTGFVIRMETYSLEIRADFDDLEPVNVGNDCYIHGPYDYPTGIGFFHGSTGNIDLSNNYWGHASGPFHLTANPDGEGAALVSKDPAVVFNFEPFWQDEEMEIPGNVQ